MSGVDRIAAVRRQAKPRSTFSKVLFGLGVLGIETAIIIAVCMFSGTAYHSGFYGETGSLTHFAAVGLLTAVIFAAPGIYRDDYQIHNFIMRSRRPGQIFMLWNMTFLVLAAIAFLTKTTGDFSRGWVVIFHPLGLLALVVAERRLGEAVRAGLASGRIPASLTLVVGDRERIVAFASQAAQDPTVEIALTLELPPREVRDAQCSKDLDASLARCQARARTLHIENVLLLFDWSETALIDKCTTAFVQMPVSVHMTSHDTLRHYPSVEVDQVAGKVTLRLTNPPLTPWQEAMKRVIDIVISGTALLLLAPVMLVVAAAIKLDTRGPVFFRQRRRGFNHREFLIWKFRTMTTLDDGDNIEQARKNDPRVTRVGRLLRKYNVDELPQLINVLAGEMSLVGPRPHAVAHDRLYEACIDEYPRRLNMLPGITGWAQVNGFRGITDTEGIMRKRVEYDVYYIQNWSLAFDVYILVMTVLSPKAYRNAH